MRAAVIAETGIIGPLVLIANGARVRAKMPRQRLSLRRGPLQTRGFARGWLNVAEANGSKSAALSGQTTSLRLIGDLVEIVKSRFVKVVMVPTPGCAHGPCGC